MDNSEDVLFFDDIDLFLDDDEEDPASQPANDDDQHAKLIEQSAHYFKELFKDGILDDGEIHSPAAGLLLQQHLQRAGYETSIILEDQKTIVRAIERHGTSLIDHVQELLERVTALYRTTIIAKQKGSTIHTVTCKTGGDETTVISVEFVPV